MKNLSKLLTSVQQGLAITPGFLEKLLADQSIPALIKKKIVMYSRTDKRLSITKFEQSISKTLANQRGSGNNNNTTTIETLYESTQIPVDNKEHDVHLTFRGLSSEVSYLRILFNTKNLTKNLTINIRITNGGSVENQIVINYDDFVIDFTYYDKYIVTKIEEKFYTIDKTGNINTEVIFTHHHLSIFITILENIMAKVVKIKKQVILQNNNIFATSIECLGKAITTLKAKLQLPPSIERDTVNS